MDNDDQFAGSLRRVASAIPMHMPATGTYTSNDDIKQ